MKIREIYHEHVRTMKLVSPLPYVTCMPRVKKQLEGEYNKKLAALPQTVIAKGKLFYNHSKAKKQKMGK